MVFSVLLSVMTIFTPALRNANSRSLVDRVSKENTNVSNISESGQKVILVPLFYGVTFNFEWTGGDTSDITLSMYLSISSDFKIKFFRQGIDDRNADAVKAT